MKVVLKIVFQVITKELYVKVMYTIKSYDENFSFSVVLFFLCSIMCWSSLDNFFYKNCWLFVLKSCMMNFMRKKLYDELV